MTVTPNEAWFIFMAVATLTILVVGTLGAADLLHRPHRRDVGDVRTAAARGGPTEHPTELPTGQPTEQPTAQPMGAAAALPDPHDPGRAA